MIVIYNKQRLKEQLDYSREYIKELNDAQLEKLLKDTKLVNAGDPEAQPWIDLIEEEQKRRQNM